MAGTVGVEAEPGTLTANQLRALAERADSYRTKEVYLVKNPPTSPEPFDIVEELPAGDERPVVLKLRTNDAHPPFKPRQQELTLMSKPVLKLEKFPDKGLDACDAVFRSLVTVEKFLVPYYARYRSAAYIKAMRDGFATNPEVLAVAHIPDSIETNTVGQGESTKRGDDQRDRTGDAARHGVAPEMPGGLYVLQPSAALVNVLEARSLDQFVAARLAQAEAAKT